MALSDWRIGIIGGGIGGIAAALALARHGAGQVEVFEGAPALAEVGAGLQISPNGVRVLEALGLGPAAAAVASAPAAVELIDHARGRPVARVPLGETARRRYGHPYWQFHRADLLSVLAEAAREAGIPLRTGASAEVTGTAEAPAIALDGREGAEPFDAVIAADGVRSPTRAAWFAGTPARFTGHVAWRGLVPARHLAAPPAETTTVRMAPGRHLVTYPLRGGSLVNFVAVEERASWTAEGWTHPDDPAALARAFAGGGPATDALLGAVQETFLWGLFDHPPVPRWNQGRIALLGDACHPMLPFLAQGATMALEDAWVLADALARAPDPAAGLAAYADRRQARAGRVQAAAARNGRVFHLGQPLQGAARLALRLASGAAPTRLLARFDWLYGADVTSGARPGAGP